jgi:DNA-directed RNA polymerase specialized sigma24 family protein
VAVAERPPTDEHLGELTAAGDLDAFTVLVDRHFQGIYDLVLRLVRDPETAADVVHNALTSAWATLQKRRAEDVRVILFAAASRVAVARAGGAKDLPGSRSSSSDPNFLALDTRRLADPAAVIGDAELVRLVWEAAAALRPRDYALLDLQLRKGLGPGDLAREFGVKRAVIDARLARLKEEFTRTVTARRANGATARVSPLAVFAALAPLAVPEGLQQAVTAGVVERTRAPTSKRWKPGWKVIAIVAGVVAAATAGALLALQLNAGPDDPTDFRSSTHRVGAETSNATIVVEWTPEPEATGYSILWSQEEALPDETVDLPGTAATAQRVVTPGQWWFNLRTRDGNGDWTHTVHMGPFVVVPVPDTKLASRPESFSSNPRPVFRIASTGEGTFECSLDGDAFENCAARVELGRIRDGRHRFQARVRDRYGNADASPVVWVWRVDTASPRTRIVSAELDKRRAKFRFASNERHSTFECRMDEGKFDRCRSPLSVEKLKQGEHVFAVRATDSAGNVERSPAVYRWEVDTRPPKTRIASGPSGTVHRAKATFVLDANEDPVTYECSLDGRAFAPCSATVTFAGLEAGEHRFAARAEDDEGNVDRTPARRRWTVVDESRPNTAITDHPGINSNDSSPTFRFRSSESGSSFECRLDSGSWKACSSPKTYHGLANGQHVFRVRARDASGNVDGSPATWTWTIH